MTAAAIIALIAEVIATAVKVGPTVIKAAQDAQPFAKLIYDQIVNKKDVSQEELDELHAKLKILSDQFQLPLDPE